MSHEQHTFTSCTHLHFSTRLFLLPSPLISCPFTLPFPSSLFPQTIYFRHTRATLGFVTNTPCPSPQYSSFRNPQPVDDALHKNTNPFSTRAATFAMPLKTPPPQYVDVTSVIFSYTSEHLSPYRPLLTSNEFNLRESMTALEVRHGLKRRVEKTLYF